MKKFMFADYLQSLAYELWVYPKKTMEKKGVIIAKDLNDEVVKVLEKGGKVLWPPLYGGTGTVK